MPLPSAPKRQDTRTFPTPIVGDVLFSQIEDCSRRTFPDYGTPHPDSVKWPSHKLVYIRPVDNERDGIYEFFYAAERANQDTYNFEFGPTNVGGITVDAVTRTYVILRSEFQPDDYTIGDSMPDIPAGQFDGDYKLFTLEQRKLSMQELDSLYVVLQITYIKDTEVTGSKYGEIVTRNVTTTVLVPDTTPPDTGIHIISSDITPIGNGLAVKQTQEVDGGEWPDPVEIDTSLPAPPPPSPLYWKSMKREVVTRKVEEIPNPIALSGNEVGVDYKKETPDRFQETKTTDTFEFDTEFNMSESVERSAYLERRNFSFSDDQKELPSVGSGSSRVVYRAGDLEIYENSYEETSAITGLKGVDTNAQSWGSITETTNYTTSSTAIAGGSVRLIYKDGMTTVYEATSVSIAARGSNITSNAQPWGVITKSGVYQTAPVTGLGKDSRQVWSNGVSSVYLNETDEITVNGTTVSYTAQPWGTIKKDGIYEEEPNTDLGVDSRLVWTNGVDKVYLNETDELIVNGASFTSAKEVNRLLTEVETTSYSKEPVTETDNCRSRVIYSTHDERIYENVEIVITPAEEPRVYGSVMQYSVPSILVDIRTITYPLKKGGVEIYYEPEIEEGMSGSFPCEVTEYYTEDPQPPDLEELTSFTPKPISFRTPWAELRIGATLHEQFIIPYSTGTTDIKYEYFAENIIIPATVPPTWKGKVVLANYTTQPYKNGFIVREYRITLPE